MDKSTRDVSSDNGNIRYHPCDDNSCIICAPDNPEEYPKSESIKEGENKNE